MHSVACVGISGRFFTSFSRRCKLIITLRWWSPRMSFSIWELIYFCMQFSKYMSDWSLSVIKNQNLFWSLITGKDQFISFFKLFIIWRPPALPHRLQCSTIGRLRLNRRVRDGNGCFPQAHRHQKIRVTKVSAQVWEKGCWKLASIRTFYQACICDAVATEELCSEVHLRTW